MYEGNFDVLFYLSCSMNISWWLNIELRYIELNISVYRLWKCTLAHHISTFNPTIHTGQNSGIVQMQSGNRATKNCESLDVMDHHELQTEYWYKCLNPKCEPQTEHCSLFLKCHAYKSLEVYCCASISKEHNNLCKITSRELEFVACIPRILQ